MFVYDLNHFVTVQLLEETLAVHTKWENYRLQNGQFRPGLFTNTGCASSSTTPPQESLEPDAHLVSGNTAASSSSSDSALEQSDKIAARKWCRSATKTPTKNKKRDDSRDADDLLRDLPEWFTDNLEDTELHVSAHISQDSGSEHPTKVASES